MTVSQAAPKLRICIATGRYYRNGETFVNRHVTHLFGGNSVVLCGRRTAQDPLGRPVFSRARAHLNPVDLLTAPWQLWNNHSRYRAPFVPYGRARARLERFLRDHVVDVVLAEFGSQAVSVWPLARDMGLPVFAYFRGRDASRYLRVPSRVEGYRRMMPELAGVFSESRFLLDNLAKVGLQHLNSHVVHSGTDIDAFGPKNKTIGKILFVGRFVEKKAPLLTLKSFLAIAEKHPHATVHFIGNGPLLSACCDHARRSRFRDRVMFHGHLAADKVVNHLADADILALHSVTGRDGETEGLPVAIQEAMASGVAVLSTEHAGIPEIIKHNETGVLVKERDAAAMAAALDRMLSNPEWTRALGTAAREFACSQLDYRQLYARVEAVIRAGAASQSRSTGAV